MKFTSIFFKVSAENHKKSLALYKIIVYLL